MGSISDTRLATIRRTYQQGYSANEIANLFHVPLNAVYYFFRKHHILRRTPRENSAIQFQKKPLSFKVRSKFTRSDETLKVAGIMLYWAEGSKWEGEVIVDFANSDVMMIKIFLKFLRKICGINEQRLRAYLYCYENQNPRELINYWSAITRISKKKFSKPYVRKDYQLSKTGKMKYGLIHIRYGDKKLFLLIKQWINEYARRYSQ